MLLETQILVSKIKRDIQKENQTSIFYHLLSRQPDLLKHKLLINKIESIENQVYNLGKMYRLKPSTLFLWKTVFNKYLWT